MPTPRRRKRNPAQEAEDRRPIPPLFQQWLMAALEATPEDPRAERASSRIRSMPRQKVAAAYFHCLKLSLSEIARGAGRVVCRVGMKPRGGKRPCKSLSYGLLGQWRTELEFNALVERAKAEMIGALKGAYDSIQVPEEFEHFAKELMDYQLDIIFALVRYAEAVAESSGEWLRQLWADVLFQRWARACGGRLGKLSHPWAREVFPLLELVEGAGVQFAKAEENRDWQLAREAFDSIEVLAKLHAARADASPHRVGVGVGPGRRLPKAE